MSVFNVGAVWVAVVLFGAGCETGSSGSGGQRAADAAGGGGAGGATVDASAGGGGEFGFQFGRVEQVQALREA